MARAYISLGTNVDREHNLKQGLTALNACFGELTLSSLFESEAVGFDGSPFYNMVVGITSELAIAKLAIALRDIEYANGRSASSTKFSPRTLDLDLLLYDDLVLQKPVQIPRDEINLNAFVLWPLAEVAPDLVHPLLKKSYSQLWDNFDKNSQQLKIKPQIWTVNSHASGDKEKLKQH
jgi:2-amino-4-hydroxy-6-hydroxymethyldihydropteridine diphosphokinase